MVSTPWAKDAEGKDVKTWFTTDGKTLTQHVKHDVVGIVYPVTADPVIIPWWIISRIAYSCVTGLAVTVTKNGITGQSNTIRNLVAGCVGSAMTWGLGKYIPHSVKAYAHKVIYTRVIYEMSRRGLL